MSDKVYIIGPDSKEAGYYILPSDYDNNYFYNITPYAYQNLYNGLIDYNENTIETELSKAIKGVEEQTENNPIRWLKIINTEDCADENLLDFTFEKDFAINFGRWINNNFKFSNRNILQYYEIPYSTIDNAGYTTENNPSIFYPQFGIFWNSYYNMYYGIWYTPITKNGQILTKTEANDYLINLGKKSSYILSDTFEIILRTTKELGFSLFDIESCRLNNPTESVKEKLKDLVTWGKVLTKVQVYYHLLINKSNNEDLLNNYLFVDENMSIFSSINKSIFCFNIEPENYFGDLNSDIEYQQLEYWDSTKDYKTGDLVLGTTEKDSSIYNYLYRCCNTHTANGNFERIVTISTKNSDGSVHKKSVQQWEYLTNDYEQEITALEKACSETGKTFDKNEWVRFTIPAIEGNNQIEYFSNGEVKPNYHSGVLSWSLGGISLRQVFHVGLAKNSYDDINNKILDGSIELKTEPKITSVENAITIYKELISKDSLSEQETERRDEAKGIINLVSKIIVTDYLNIENSPWLLPNGDVDYNNPVVEPWDEIEPLDDYLVKYNAPEGENWKEQLSDRHSSPCNSTVTNINTGGKIIRYFKKSDLPQQVICKLEGKLRSIGDNVFINRKELLKVVLKNTVTKIGKKAFSGCINLQQVLLPKGLKILSSNAFSGCTSLVRATLPKGITILDGVYVGCTNLKTVVLSTNCTRIGDYTFSNCLNLQRVYNIDKLKVLGVGAFNNCKSLEYFSLNKDIKILPAKLFKNCKKCKFDLTKIEVIEMLGEGCFEGCEELTQTIDFSHLDKLYPNTYKNCKKITNIVFNFKSIPDEDREVIKGIKSNVYIIPSHFCYGCSNLKQITFDEKTEQLNDSCFENCGSLTRVTIPDKVNTIGKRIFYDSFQLGELNIPVNYTPMIGEKVHPNTTWIEKVLNSENKDNWVDRLFTHVYVNGRRVYW